MKRIGIIDLGSNNARLVVFELFGEGYFTVIDEYEESVRLGQDMEKGALLKPMRIAETIKILRFFKKLADSYKVDKIIAVATSAVRMAKNQRSFLDEIQSSCGIKLRVLSEEEEAMLIYRSVINSLDVPKGLIVEIGGGSTKIVYYNRRTILNYASLPFGAVTLTDMFKEKQLSPNEQAIAIEKFIKKQFDAIDWLKDIDQETQMIGVGGSFRNLFKIYQMTHKYPLNSVHNYHMNVDDFQELYDMIKGLDLDRKKKIKGIAANRADILTAAFAIIKSFTELFNFDMFILGRAGIREGIIFQEELPISNDKPMSDIMQYSIDTILAYHNIEKTHITHVVHLSKQLFIQLRVLHKLSKSYLKILLLAANLHDIGRLVKFYDHQKHSCYFIHNAHLYGVTHREMVLAGFVASCHHNEEITNAEWLRFRGIITEEDLENVKKLGVILRIAESLDRSHSGVVKNINCDILGDSAIMKLEVEDNADLEIRSAMKAFTEFKKFFHKNLEIL